jgi:acyl-CoA hydrolase
VRLTAEDPIQGQVRLCGTAFLTFVGTDAAGLPQPVPAVRPESELEGLLFAGAPARMADRRQARREVVAVGEFPG